MRKADIANEIFKQVGISKNEAADIVELVLNLLKSVLQKGESVKVAGFGNFVVRSKGARKGRNPRTGEEIGITPRRVVTFRPSQVFPPMSFVSGSRSSVFSSPKKAVEISGCTCSGTLKLCSKLSACSTKKGTRSKVSSGIGSEGDGPLRSRCRLKK
jgi:integration host factor subunit alpha